jgi:hypothetical protein
MGARSQLPQQAPGETLFQRLHYQRGVAALRFAEQKVHMLGHDDIADDNKMIAAAHLFQDPEKEITIPRAVKKCAAMVTTGRDKVQVSSTVITAKRVWHPG